MVVSYHGFEAEIDYDPSKSVAYNLSLGLQAAQVAPKQSGMTQLMRLREHFCYKVDSILLSSFDQIEGKPLEIVNATLKIIPLDSGEIVCVTSDKSLEYEIE